MKDNDALPRIEADPDSLTVRIDAAVIEPAPGRRPPSNPAILLI